MKGHWSDCAVHNAPESPAGPCDCDGFDETEEKTETVLRKDMPGTLGDFLRKAANITPEGLE